MKTILIFVIVLLLVSCGRISQRQPALESSDTLTFELCQISENEIDTLVVLSPASEIDSLAMVLIAEAVHIPVGSNLVLNTFEDKWYRWSSIEESDNQKWLSGVSRQFIQQYNPSENSATIVDGKYFRPLFNITPDISHLNINKEFRAIAIYVAKYQHFKMYSFLTEYIIFGGIQDIQIQSLVSISNGRVIDNLLVAYRYSDGYGNSESQFFYYDGEHIHIKRIDNSTHNEWTLLAGYWKYQLTPHGKFIRYYEQNGFLENDNERGLVKNNTREGKWVDMSGIFYIEAEYKNGLPVSRRYYQMLRDSTAEGFEISSSRQRGELLYIETFENGRLVRRELVNNLWEWDMDFFD